MKIRLSSKDAILPTRANETDAGLDLYVPDGYGWEFKPGEKRIINTNVQVAIPTGYAGLLMARSSLQKKNLMLANSVGLIDSGYRGDLQVVLVNVSTSPTMLIAGEKFAQLVIVPVMITGIDLVEDSDDVWNNTSRGVGGFGSTGK